MKIKNSSGDYTLSTNNLGDITYNGYSLIGNCILYTSDDYLQRYVTYNCICKFFLNNKRYGIHNPYVQYLSDLPTGIIISNNTIDYLTNSQDINGSIIIGLDNYCIRPLDSDIIIGEENIILSNSGGDGYNIFISNNSGISELNTCNIIISNSSVVCGADDTSSTNNNVIIAYCDSVFTERDNNVVITGYCCCRNCKDLSLCCCSVGFGSELCSNHAVVCGILTDFINIFQDTYYLKNKCRECPIFYSFKCCTQKYVFNCVYTKFLNYPHFMCASFIGCDNTFWNGYIYSSSGSLMCFKSTSPFYNNATVSFGIPINSSCSCVIQGTLNVWL